MFESTPLEAWLFLIPLAILLVGAWRGLSLAHDTARFIEEQSAQRKRTIEAHHRYQRLRLEAGKDIDREALAMLMERHG